MFSGRGPAILFLSRNKVAGRVKVIISFIKIITNLNEVEEEIKALSEVMFFFIQSF